MTGTLDVKNDQIIHGAMIGTGQVAKYHMSAWSKLPDVKIVALANRTVSRAQALADEYEIDSKHVYADYRELLEKETLDFVDIATAPDIHYQQVMDATRHGINIFCQKPFACSLVQAEKMMEAAQKAGVLLSVNENWRWRSWYREVKDLLISGVIGKPRYFRIERRSLATLTGLNGEPPALVVKQPYTQDLDRLILFEWGIHLLDVIRFLFGDIQSVYARLQHVSPFVRGEDRALVLASASQVDCVVDISWASIVEAGRPSQLEYVVIEGDQGTIELLPQQDDLLRITSRSGVVERQAFKCTPEAAYQSSYDAAHRHFIECLKSGVNPETVAKDNYKTLAVVFAAYRSFEMNRVVNLNG